MPKTISGMQLHPRLAQDTHVLGSTTCGVLLLHRNASLPWFILVPDTTAAALYRMPTEQRQRVEAEWNTIASWAHDHFDCDRVNVAAIGNVVPQLHLHVVARHEGDPCWPGVVWGQPLPEASWSTDQLAELRTALRDVVAFANA